MLRVTREPLILGSFVVGVRRNLTVGPNFGMTLHSELLGLLRRSSSPPQKSNFEEAEFHLDLEEEVPQ